MSSLHWIERPRLDQPVVIAAFEGWNDAGEAATGAVEHLRDGWRARSLASIDPEEYFDFTTVRPHVRLEGGVRRIDWPTTDFWWAAPDGAPGVVLLRGIEPQLRWRTFCTEVVDVAEALGARLVLTLGALLADVAHTRPSPVYGTADDPEVAAALHLEPSRYEGPTGVVGVLHDLCTQRAMNSASLWAAVPSYVPAAPSPKATVALMERVCGILRTPLPDNDLDAASTTYEHQISELVDEDEETAAYVAHLEETYDREAIAGDHAEALVSEVERFLREQR